MKKLLMLFGSFLYMIPTLAQKGADRGKISDISDDFDGGIGLSGFLIIIILIGILVAFVHGLFVKKNK